LTVSLSREAAYPWLASLAVALVVLGFRDLGWLQAPELVVYDTLLEGEPRSASSDVVLVEITERDIAEQGHWPISDRVLAEALRRITDGGPRAVGLDLYRDLPNPPGESHLRRVLREDARIFAVEKLGEDGGRGIPGPSILEGSGRIGANDLTPDPGDEAVRRGLYFLDDSRGEPQPSFAWLMALNALAPEGLAATAVPGDPGAIRLGDQVLRPLQNDDGGYVDFDSAGYQVLLDYAAGPLVRYRLGEVLGGGVPAEVFRDAVVLLGSNAESLPDIFPVPQGGSLSGLEIHGHAIDQLIRIARGQSSPRKFVREWLEVLVVFLAGLTSCAVILGLHSRFSPGPGILVASTLAGLGLLAATAYGLFQAGWWWPVVAPSLAWLGTAAFAIAWLSSQERAQRDQLMSLFSRHVSSDVARELWRNSDAFIEDGRPPPVRLRATVLFADMKGFSSRAESMEPDRLMDWVNRFMDAMAGEVDRHGGMVDGYLGDGIMADFGVPIARETEEEIARDAANAVECARAMAGALESLNARNRDEGYPECAMRIGVDSGAVVAGSLGSAGRLQYTVIGETAVNAQRLESTPLVEHDFDRDPVRILASEATCALLGPEVETESLGEIAVKGKQGSLALRRIRLRGAG